MNREQAKKLLPIIQAFAEGKTIQVKASDGLWYGREGENCEFNFNADPQMYRIKSKPKYRPFRSWTELRREMQRHSPYGVVVAKEVKKARFKIKDEVFAVYKSKTYEDAFKLIEFADGSVFGIKEE